MGSTEDWVINDIGVISLREVLGTGNR
jgi:hypothetical protein